MAVNRNGGLTNGVVPGYKCTDCKEAFLRQYLQPQWENPTAVWQSYGIISLSPSCVQKSDE